MRLLAILSLALALAACGPAAPKFQGSDVTGAPFELEGEALLARALQHENDHLIGKLLIDQVGPVKREMIKRKMKKEAAAAAEEEASARSAG